MSQLVELLAAELERPRVLSAQVIKHLTETYGRDRESLGEFLEKELTRLEDFEIDLTLSPLFTPTLKDQARFADFLGRKSMPQAQWPALVNQLAARPTCAQLITDDQQVHLVNLRNVTIERFVHRLRLEGGIPEGLFHRLDTFPTVEDRPMLKAIARRAIWDHGARREIFEGYLDATLAANTYQLADAIELLKLVETYQPERLDALLMQIPHWQQVLRQEINAGTGAKPFFNERVEELHGGGRDQRRQDNARQAAKVSEFEFLQRLQAALGGGVG